MTNIKEPMQQCLLENRGSLQVAWISTRGAKLGVQVELKGDPDLWKVVEVYPGQLSADYVTGNERNFKTHRIATDI
jgi:hypothetical protein